MESEADRKSQLAYWLTDTIQRPYALTPLPHDASFRRYFRLSTDEFTFIVMDAPPPLEQTQSYVAITRALRAMGLNSPDIIAAHERQGFLLITDFGDTTYLKALNRDNADSLYRTALQSLAVLQRCQSVPGYDVPCFTAAFMMNEWAWHKEWFAHQWLHMSLDTFALLDRCYEQLVDSIAAQPQVFMHRDYHSANLMALPNTVGILDFQDAFMGPVTYDVASLLRDCYVNWPDASVSRWVLSYWQLLRDDKAVRASQDEFLQWFDWMSVQRHLKALMTFARKQVRDGQSQYLQHIPRTLSYLQDVTGRYPELAPLSAYINHVVAQCEQ